MTRSAPDIIVDAYGLTDVGVVRANNEDNFLIESSSNLNVAGPTDDGAIGEGAIGNIFIVADGMGGMQAGEVASQMAVESVASRLIEQLKQSAPRGRRAFARLLTGAIEETNRLVLEESARDNALKGMGTTLTAAVVYDKAIFFAQLGDSRAYLVRNGHIMQMTKDQSLVAKLIANGTLRPEDAKTHPRRNIVLQALGVQAQVNVAVTYADLKRGDRLVLCSDGLWSKVEPEEMYEHIERSNPALACKSLVQLAGERGGDDNITIIVAAFDGEGLPQAMPDEIPRPIDVDPRLRWRFWHWARA